MKKKNVHIYINHDTHKRVRQLALEMDTTASEIYRDAVELYLEQKQESEGNK
jgi:predicted transcriptional regulator